MRYARSRQDLERDAARDESPAAPRAIRSIRCVYETDAEAVEAVVPRPLEVSPQAEVVVFFEAFTPDAVRVSEEVRSATFGVRVEYDGRPGIYPVTMPASSEQLLLQGRERYGEPRKLARLALEADLDSGTVSASVERMGVRFLAATGRMREEIAPYEETDRLYCLKVFPGCEREGVFDQDPQLVRRIDAHRFERAFELEGGLDLWESPYDPVVDLPLRRLSSLRYVEGRTLVSGRVIRPVPGEWLRFLLHQRYDTPEVEGRDV